MAYSLTKLDIAALRKADFLTVHLGKDGARVYVVKRADTSKDVFASDKEHFIAAPVALHVSYGPQADSLQHGAHCFATINFYHSQATEASTTIHALREGDEIVFEFYPDAHSNAYVARAGLHGDALYLKVTRGAKRLRFEFDTSICPNNSARMCRDVPSADWYYSQTKDVA